MEVFAGPGALSPSREGQLLAQVREVVPSLAGLRGAVLHFVRTDSPLSSETRRTLERLLDYGEIPPDPAALNRPDLVVAPRPGTVSPWSSRATDIVHRCGLTDIQRVERGVGYALITADGAPLGSEQRAAAAAYLHDPMVEAVFSSDQAGEALFQDPEPEPLKRIPVLRQGRAALEEADRELGLALDQEEMDYLVAGFTALGRDPTDAEVLMFAQANSEHCRHKIFRARWIVDGQEQPHSPFGLIRATYDNSPEGILSAYDDNGAVIEGLGRGRFYPDPGSGTYRQFGDEPVPIVMKVETHNHPTAISPFPGAATGAGGEIRDEAATGRGGKPKAGVTGFTTSHLRIPEAPRPWEPERGRPARFATPLDIMTRGPLGSARFNNEYGRPGICGYFRTFELEVEGPQGTEQRGYHKPLMLAGGMGNIRPAHVHKASGVALPPGTPVGVLGGPALRIGLGGGAASSQAGGSGDAELDFASVQRGDPEMQRRAQEVIDACWALGEDSPILSVHDVGAGGLSNALPELVAEAGWGGCFDLDRIPRLDSSLSPAELWCTEAQERYVLAVDASARAWFETLCARERCPFAMIGEVTSERRIRATTSGGEDPPVDMDLDLLLGKAPGKTIRAARAARFGAAIDLGGLDIPQAARRILQFPAVADKGFLITIGDRTVTGQVARDPMVGPWQVPVADVGVTLSGPHEIRGEAVSMGERPPLALLSAGASARMAVGEALTNMAAASVPSLDQVRFSGNWMAAADKPGDDAALYDAVSAVSDLCAELGIAIPVGKDSLSMRAGWSQDGEEREVASPVSLIVTAFAPVLDATAVLTPQLRADPDTELLLIDLGGGRNRLGGSVLAQVYQHLGAEPPDIDAPQRLGAFFAAIQELRAGGLLLAYHDRSDGGLLAAVAEMAFAGHCGLELDLAQLDGIRGDGAALFSEELGAVAQIRREQRGPVLEVLDRWGLGDLVHGIGRPRTDDRMRVATGESLLLDEDRVELHRHWSEVSYGIRARRDDPDCAREEYEALKDREDPGLGAELTFDPAKDVAAPFVATGALPPVAILREQGVNGHVEMAAAFHWAGFEARDMTMADLDSGRASLESCRGLVAPGGFSYGDVLGAGGGWAKTVLESPVLRDHLAAFFERGDTFALGVCNGCQMLSQVAELIPGAEDWPRFGANRSEQFESRLVMVEVSDSPSLFTAGMAGSRLPIPVAHGEGRPYGEAGGIPGDPCPGERVVLRYVNHYGAVTERYPFNPNGAPGGVAGVTTPDGRFTALMPHPERAIRTVQFSWHPEGWGRDGPWLRLFGNARAWLE